MGNGYFRMDHLAGAIEEEFRVRIPSRVCSNTTLEDIEAYVLRKLEENGRTREAEGTRLPCISSSMFFKLRGTLAEKLGIAPRRIRPSSRLVDLAPADVLLRQWRRIEKEQDIMLPDLEEDPPAYIAALIVYGVCIAAFLLLGAVLDPGFAFVGIMVLLFGYLVVETIGYESRRHRGRIRPLTVREAVQYALVEGELDNGYREAIEKVGIDWQRLCLRDKLRVMVAEQCGVLPGKLDTRKSFLGLFAKQGIRPYGTVPRS